MSKMTSQYVALCFCILMNLSIQGCGYTVSGSTLPVRIKTIHIEPIKNSINFTTDVGRNLYLPLLEVKIRNEVMDRYLFDGNLKTADANKAHLILRGELIKYERVPLRYTENDVVEEYRVYITVDFTMIDQMMDEVYWQEPTFTGEASYFVSGPKASTEEVAVREATIDLARRIVERTIEDW